MPTTIVSFAFKPTIGTELGALHSNRPNHHLIHERELAVDENRRRGLRTAIS
jgi:hypothetical protein